MKQISLFTILLILFLSSCSDQEYDDVVDSHVNESYTHLLTDLENEKEEIINFFDFDYAKNINKNLREQSFEKNFDQEIVR